MYSPKEVLVVTTSLVGNSHVVKYFKPVSAHVVAGTNVFSDFAASFSDFFGGRSGTYQNQITSLYNEAIERIKVSAFELGANCVVGLSVDIDEISGKGKSMFMITAVGTAVKIEYKQSPVLEDQSNNKVDVASLDKINTLKKKRAIIKKLEQDYWNLDEGDWQFITLNSTHEIFPALLKKYLSFAVQTDESAKFYERFLPYINSFPEEKKKDLLFISLLKQDDKIATIKLLSLIKDLDILDLNFIHSTLLHDDFLNKKKVLQILPYDKPFYNFDDIDKFSQIKNSILEIFIEKGSRSIKKSSLLSKEKEVWTCACGNTNDFETKGDSYCNKCNNDIYGFQQGEINRRLAIAYIDHKVDLINEIFKNDNQIQ